MLIGRRVKNTAGTFVELVTTTRGRSVNREHMQNDVRWTLCIKKSTRGEQPGEDAIQNFGLVQFAVIPVPVIKNLEGIMI
jgi:hypothetical protein